MEYEFTKEILQGFDESVERAKNFTKEEALAALQAAGIADEQGNLSEHYRSDDVSG